MPEKLSKEERSQRMSRIRSKDTKPELLVRSFLFAQGFRYRLHKKSLPGKPDLFLKKFRTVIFVHGCFWHGHANCKLFRIPKSRIEFWRTKIEQNIKRSELQEKQLKEMGYNVLVVWECELKHDTKTALQRLANAILLQGQNVSDEG